MKDPTYTVNGVTYNNRPTRHREEDCPRCGRRNLAFHSVDLAGETICGECADPARWALMNLEQALTIR
jgi:ribosomal protein S27AE